MHRISNNTAALARRVSLFCACANRLFVMALAASLLPGYALANEIVIGQTSSLTGQAATGSKENLIGARLYLDSVNARGGIDGQQIRLITLDDGYDAKKAADNARELIVKEKAVALFLPRGTPTSEALIPLTEQYRIALIAPSSGAASLHFPIKRMVFNVRTPYALEAEQTVSMLSKMGSTRIALAWIGDSFGEDGAKGAQEGFRKIGTEPVLAEKIDKKNPDFRGLADRLSKVDAHAVLIVATAGVVTDAIRALRDKGSSIQVATLGNNASSGFIKGLGQNARGVMVSQVFPYERSAAFRLVSEASRLLKAASPGEELSPTILEGFASAKVLVAALQRAGKNPSREELLATLNGMGKLDLGGISLGYGADDRAGLEFVELSVIGQNGKFNR